MLRNGHKTRKFFYKLVSAFLLSVYAFSPLSVVYADDAAIATPPQVTTTPDTGTADDSSTIPAVSPTNTPTLLQQPNQAAAFVGGGGGPGEATDEPQAVLDAQQRLNAQVNDNTGAVEYNYPITLPPGRNGMTPDLALQYDSQNTSNDSAFGYGWEISIPYISRENKHGVDNLYTGTYNDYTTSDKGELGQISGNNYQLRSDNGSFDKYAFSSSTNAWTVTTKTGLTYTYGTSTASRQDDPNNNADIYKWMLDSITDANGNSISYTYFKDQGQIYPNTITYSNFGGTNGIYTVTFTRTAAASNLPGGYMTGFDVVTAYNTTGITVTVSGTTRHSYVLEYVGDGSTRSISLLSTINEIGVDAQGNGRTLPAEKFAYTGSGAGFTKSSLTMPTHTLSGGTTYQDSILGMNGDSKGLVQNLKNGMLIDINGDGYPDWIETVDPTYASIGGSDVSQFYDVWLGGPNGWTYNAAWTAALPRNSAGQQYELNQQWGSNQLVDVNGDGLPDFVITTPGSTLNTDTDTVWLNTGSGWTKSTTWTMPTMSISGTTYGIGLGYNAGGINGYVYDTQVIDINNDGLPDIVQTSGDGLTNGTTSDHYSVWLNTGTGWTKSTTWVMPVDSNGNGSIVTGQGGDALIDVNGDGLPDWVEIRYSPTSNDTYGVWLNTGSSWVRSTSWSLPVHTAAMPPYTSTSAGVQLGFSQIICNVGIGNSYVCGTRSDTMADVNGDGLPDIVETVNNTNFLDYDVVWLNNGKNGWTRDSSWTMPMYENTYGLNPNEPMRLGNDGFFSTQMIDVNGDGLPDIVASCDCGTSGASANPQWPMIFVDSGSGWSTTGWNQPTRTNEGSYNGSILGYTNFNDGPDPYMFRDTVLQDVNNDGSPDWIESSQFENPQNVGTQTPYERYDVWTNAATQADLLSSVTTSQGASDTYTYGEQIITDKNTNGQSQTVEAETSDTTNDGIGDAPTVTSYAYANGKYFYPTNSTWRKFAGFQKITVTNPDGGKTVNYYHQGNGIDSSTYEYSDDEYQIGKLYRTDNTDNSGNLYKRTTTEWTTVPITSTNNNVAFVYPNQVITETFDGYSTEKATAETWAYNTSTGNLTTDTNYGQVTATTPLTFTDTGTDEQITNDTYATNGTGIYMLDDQIKTDQSLNKVWEAQYYYDNLPLGSLTLGNQTQVSQWKSGSTYSNSKKSYNANGTVATMTDGLGYVTTNTAYDANNLYPITVTDPLSHVTQYTYDYMFGLPVQTTDPNGQIYITNYDYFGRVKNRQIPDPSTGSTTTSMTAVYQDNATGLQNTEKSITVASGSTSYLVEDYYDDLGRLVEERRQFDPNNHPDNYYVTDSWYDANGKLSKQSLPYLQTSPSYTRGSGNPALNVSYTYDPMQRILTTTNNLGTTTNVYNDWKTTTTDPNGNVKNYYYDAFGNLAKVDEINAGTTYTTTYAWNLNHLLLKIVDAAGNQRTFGWDGLGNRVSAQDLHVPTDTTFGTWIYSYDLDNDLFKTVTPNGATINYTYDHGNRVLTEDWTGGTGTDITYGYDTCTLGVGKLCSVSMLSGANTSYTYDHDGNVASENRTINSNNFVTSYTHDIAGDIATITYPDNAVVQYNYVSDGLLGSVQEKESGGSFANVVSGITYSPNLQITSMTYGNGVATTNNYDWAQLYRLANKTSTNSSGNIQNTAYTYDADGNITNLADSSIEDTAKTVAYTYDNLNRIKTATATGVASGTTPYSETYTYDALGNILTKNGQTYLYQGNTGTSYADPDAATSINSLAFTTNYDKDGNMTSNDNLSNTWNYKDQLTQTVAGSTTVNYTYDQDGNRVLYNNGSSTTYYPNQYYSYDGTTKTKQIYAGNDLVGTFQTAGGVMTPYYILTDSLLGTSLATNSTGAVKQVLDYYPFGGIRLNEQTGTLNEKNKFGGHQYDTETDLNYLGARYYNAKVGRFISEDPSYLAMGDSNQLQQDTNQTLIQNLMDPQSFNAYSYAENNPLTKIDPNGKYWQLSASATALGWSGEVGIRADSTGLNLVLSGGLGVGLEGKPLSLSYTPGDVNHETETSTVIGGSAAYFGGLGVSKEGTYVPSTYSLDNASVQKSAVIGLGLDAYIRKEISIPILGKEQPSQVNNQPATEYLSSGKNQLQVNTSSTMASSAPAQNNFFSTINSVVKLFKR